MGRGEHVIHCLEKPFSCDVLFDMITKRLEELPRGPSYAEWQLPSQVSRLPVGGSSRCWCSPQYLVRPCQCPMVA